MKRLISVILLLLTACVHTPSKEVFLNENLLPDGTWVVEVRASCEDSKSQKCRDKIKKLITAHATNLCAAAPDRITNCVELEEPDHSVHATCYANCR